jgi:hypothetical protein
MRRAKLLHPGSLSGSMNKVERRENCASSVSECEEMGTENPSEGYGFRGLAAPVFERTLRMILPVVSQATPSDLLQCDFHVMGSQKRTQSATSISLIVRRTARCYVHRHGRSHSGGRRVGAQKPAHL